MREIKNEYKASVGKPEGKRTIGKPRGRLQGNVEMDFRKIGCCDVDWIHLARSTDQWGSILQR
jgi:hypothetical protein